MKKKKLVGCAFAVTEILGLTVLLELVARKNPEMFLCSMMLYMVMSVSSMFGAHLTINAFLNGDCNEAKAVGIGIMMFGLCVQAGIFGLMKAVEVNMKFCIILAVLGGFTIGQYLFALFRATTDSNHRPGSDFGS